MLIGRRGTITAAARRIKFSRSRKKKIEEQPWEDRAWEVYDRLPEVHYGVQIRRGIAERFDYFPARRTDPTSEPIRVGLELEDEDGNKISPPESDSKIEDLLDAEGGTEMLRRVVTELVAHFDIAGRAYLVAFMEDDERTWKVLSTQELRKKTSDTKTYERLDADGNASGEEIDDENVFVVWRPHPRNARKPDSPLRASLEVAEQLILLNREMRARSLSRLSAGILGVPDSMDFEADDEEDEDEILTFEQELTDRMTRPITDAGSASSVVPWVVTGDAEDLPALRHITFDRDWDVSRDDREELIRRLANGMDLPPEILLGLADVNHWTAWQVNESAVTQHVDPTVRLILDSLTTGWFVPLLAAANIDTAGIVLWRDLTPAIVPADRTQQHFEALGAGLIGFDAAREHLGYDSDEKPDLDELELIGWLTGRGDPSKGGPVDIGSGTTRREPPEEEGPPQEQTPPEQEATAAAAVPRHDVSLDTLSQLDQLVLDFTLTTCEAALDAVIARAAARLRSQAQGNSQLKAAVRGLDNQQLGQFAHKSPHLFQSDEVVKREDFASVLTRIRARWARTRTAAREFLSDLIEQPVAASPDEQLDLDQGIDSLAGVLFAAAIAALFTPGGDPDPADVGEVRDLRLPVSEIRNSMSVAGGGAARYEPGAAWELIANGRHTTETLQRFGAAQLTFTWNYGDPGSRVTNFLPHRRLHGVTFSEWDDERLTVTSDGAWTGVSHYRPGDHRGCLCTYTRKITLVR